MTLTTTGLQPVASADETAVDAIRAARRVAGLGHRPLSRLLVGLDAVAGAVAVVVGMWLTPAWARPVLALTIGAWPLAVLLAGGYARPTGDSRAVRPRALVAAAAQLALLGWCVLALAPAATTTSDPRALAVSSLVVALTATVTSIALRGLVPLVVPHRPVRIVLVGAPGELRTLVREADNARGPAFDPVAVCLPGPEVEVGPDPAEPWLVPSYHEGAAHLDDVVRRHRPDAVVAVPGPGVGHAELRRWSERLHGQGVDLLVSTGLRDVVPTRLGLSTMGGRGLLHVRHTRTSAPTHRVKAVLDRVVALVLLVLMAPLLGALVLLIRWDSPGPALFRQTRVGRHGRRFTVLKLRTMCRDADLLLAELAEHNEHDLDGLLFKIKRDPRVTRLGAFLRTSSLDELPQLWNVVCGEMSLIGPRPALPREVEAYDDDMRHRLDVKPGMTGLWQVSGRSDLPWEETVRLDLCYVDNWSWALDLRIALRTAGAVLSRRGAY